MEISSINTICDYSETRLRLLKNLKNNKTNNVKMKSLNGYDAIREELDKNNTLTVKQPVVVNEQTKTKSVLY